MSQPPQTNYTALAILAIVVLGGFGFLLSGTSFYTPWLAQRDRDAEKKPVQTGCVSASGRVWSDVQLYLDADCAKPQAVVIGGKGDRVKFRFPDGSEEWKTRQVARDLYVKAEDPAIAAQKWVEP